MHLHVLRTLRILTLVVGCGAQNQTIPVAGAKPMVEPTAPTVRLSTTLVGTNQCAVSVEVALLEGVSTAVSVVAVEVSPEVLPATADSVRSLEPLVVVGDEPLETNRSGARWLIASAEWRRWVSSPTWRVSFGDCVVRSRAGLLRQLAELDELAGHVRSWHSRSVR